MVVGVEAVGKVELFTCVLVLLEVGVLASIGINGTEWIIVDRLNNGVVRVYNYTVVAKVVGKIEVKTLHQFLLRMNVRCQRRQDRNRSRLRKIFRRLAVLENEILNIVGGILGQHVLRYDCRIGESCTGVYSYRLHFRHWLNGETVVL